tara:strand:- start:3 stop:584 length:582 start_codon:yes stop_codon:yes gene_type:complete
MTTMTTINYSTWIFKGESYIKLCDHDKVRKIRKEEHEEEVEKLVEHRDSWRSAYAYQEKKVDKAQLEIAKLKSIITSYENKITKYQEKIDIQGATIISLKTEVDVLEQLIEEEIYTPVIECELEPVIESELEPDIKPKLEETKICKGSRCGKKGVRKSVKDFICKRGKERIYCVVCRDYNRQKSIEHEERKKN